MDEKENYWRKHHWGVVQGVSGIFCAAWSVWTYFHPAATPAQSNGVVLLTSHYTPTGLLVGFAALGLSVAIPALRNIWKERKRGLVRKATAMRNGVDLQGSILELYFKRSPDGLTSITKVNVLARLQITNHGPTEVTIEGLGITASLPNFHADGTIERNTPDSWRIKKIKPGLLNASYELSPIHPMLGSPDRHSEIYQQGHSREGWVNFAFYLSMNAVFPNACFTIFVKDVLGGEHLIVRPVSVYEMHGEVIEEEAFQ